MIFLYTACFQEYDTLPTFIKGQLSLDQMNKALATVHSTASGRAAGGDVAGEAHVATRQEDRAARNSAKWHYVHYNVHCVPAVTVSGAFPC
jgi:hypothetical protein